MSASQLPLVLVQRHQHRQLFADRYLDVTLPQRDAWLALRDEAAPVFADADVFPVIIVVERPTEGTVSEDHQVQVSNFPRAALRLINLDSYVTQYSHSVPQRRLGRNAWSLEASGIDDLMEKIRQAGPTLAEYAGVKPYRGVLTGFNEAFLIDTPTRDRLIRDAPQCAAIIKPYLRGQDIKRWPPHGPGCG
ncbi:MAG: hypothetical protein EOM24_18110 [Chloroflexia bacterium]|nr:hypothetical protein [Chloroflexia bacterium]